MRPPFCHHAPPRGWRARVQRPRGDRNAQRAARANAPALPIHQARGGIPAEALRCRADPAIETCSPSPLLSSLLPLFVCFLQIETGTGMHPRAGLQ